jgi:Arc/MetJ-type ribon-helix-helix transcriptional regulator
VVRELEPRLQQRNVTLKIPAGMIRENDTLVEQHGEWSRRSDFIKTACRQYFEQLERKKRGVDDIPRET